MLHLLINDESVTLDAETTLDDLLEQQGYAKGTVAVAIDGQFVPRSAYASVTLMEGQALEIVSPMQGG